MDVLTYLTRTRSLSMDSIKQFQLGFAPYPSFSDSGSIDHRDPLQQPSLTAFLLAQGFELADMEYIGLTVVGKNGPYDRFR